MQAREAGSSKKYPAKGGPPLGARGAVKFAGVPAIWMLVWATTPASEGLDVLEGGMIMVWAGAVVAQQAARAVAVVSKTVERRIRIGVFTSGLR